MCSMPRRVRARPSCVGRERSTLPPAGGGGGGRRGRGGRGVEGPPGAVGIEGNGQTIRLEDYSQRTHDGGGGLAGPELRIEQPLGGVVQDGDEGLAPGRTEPQPRMGAAVEVQEFTEARARLAAAAMAAPGAPFADEAGLLERELDE